MPQEELLAQIKVGLTLIAISKLATHLFGSGHLCRLARASEL